MQHTVNFFPKSYAFQTDFTPPTLPPLIEILVAHLFENDSQCVDLWGNSRPNKYVWLTTLPVWKMRHQVYRSTHDRSYSLLNLGTHLGVISKVRTSRTNERTFIWEGGGLDPIRCAIDSRKKKKKKKNTDCAAGLADKSKSPIKCCKSLRDLEQVQTKTWKRALGACIWLQSIHRRYRLAFEGQVEGTK